MDNITLTTLPFARELPGVVAFNTQRGKTMAKHPYSQWNLCDYVGDDALAVMNARITLAMQLGIDVEQLIIPQQTHSTHVAVIDRNFLQADMQRQYDSLKGVDALVSRERGICIGVNTADCVNVVLIDPEEGVTGVAHAGWKGTAARIVKTTVQAMQRLGAKPERIYAAFGASICPDCFEVGNEVVEHFGKLGWNTTKIMHRNPTTGKAHIHLIEACKLTLQESGLKPEHMSQTGECTRCQSEKYFSARRLGVNSGRLFTGIMLCDQ